MAQKKPKTNPKIGKEREKEDQPERRENNFRIFLTNDDGIYAEGLLALARELSPLADITIVAPDGPRSAVSHSITLHKPLRLHAVNDFPWNVHSSHPRTSYKCSGSPSDCVMLGVLEIMKDKPPHLVISGINDGPNMAEDLTYSGTVAAAMEGAILGFPSISVSLARSEARHFDTAAYFVKEIIAKLFSSGNVSQWYAVDINALKAKFGGKLFINVNIPDLPINKVRGIRVCKPGFRGYKDVIQRMTDPRGRPFYWIAGERIEEDSHEDTDVQSLSRGYIAVTPLTWEIFFEPAFKKVKQALE